ncbi:hypothetical protein [Kitasatospora sp. NPDC089509]|uniref:hypothetical protein n=1 Tax=Kitasatospora sp. NPDC089509 TaxID=3364079 RepID=UPI00382649B4
MPDDRPEESTELHFVRIELTDAAPAEAAPETAAVRVIALLSGRWRVSLVGVSPTTATLSLTAPGTVPAAAVEEAVDEVLARPELRGWVRADR